MQRLLTLVFLLCLAVPAGISISGCTRNPAGNYCNGLGYGLKLTSVASIDLEPRTTGVSIAFGQTLQVAAPRALTCKGSAASVSSYTYGTTNNQLLDISPSGSMCGGTWNRRSGGGIPDYTICNPPSPLPSTNQLPYATVFITATADAVTSNQVEVFVHAPVTAVSLVLEPVGNPASTITGCLSQTQTAQLDAQAYYVSNGTQQLLCSPTPQPSNPNVPNSPLVPSCSAAVGDLTYTSQNSTVATIDQNGVITAVLPGTTYITASVAGSGSSAGYFSTCPPASINVSLNGATTGTVTQGVTQNLVTTITDTKGNTIQGLTLDYQSTNPLDISAGAGGAITANFAGEATIYAVCQPTTCNPAPIDKVGVNQTGTSITSNSVTITTPGVASDYVWYASPMSPANPQPAGSTAPDSQPLPGYAPSAGSQYFVPVQLISGTIGSPVKMPYVPNTMVMDRTGTSLYFGSSHELMIYATGTNSLTKEDPNVPGVVLAAAPDNSKILINDPLRQIFYVYTPSSGSFSSYSGLGTSAQWTPDAKTLYIVGTDPTGKIPMLFVNNVNTGWTTYKLPDASSDLALTVPGIGAFLSGPQTLAYAWCPLTSAGDIVQAYPQIASVAEPATDILGATIDGAHMLGVGSVNAGTGTLTDINLNFSASLNNGACPASASGGTFTSTEITVSPVTTQSQAQIAPPGVAISMFDQVLPSPASNLAFITYSGTNSAPGTANQILPYYQPVDGATPGPVNYLTLQGSPVAPITGAFSLDDTLFFVSTSGDNLVHIIDLTKTPYKDSQQINPGLQDINGNPLPATIITVKPRSTT
jgi:trimeric autotransporter adhesin